MGDPAEKAVKAFMGNLRPDFAVVRPQNPDSIARDYGIQYVPSNFVVNPDGMIVARPEAGYDEAEWKREVYPHIPGAT
jgi:hypothetical protein